MPGVQKGLHTDDDGTIQGGCYRGREKGIHTHGLMLMLRVWGIARVSIGYRKGAPLSSMFPQNSLCLESCRALQDLVGVAGEFVSVCVC